MPKMQQVRHAIRQWLAARAGFHAHGGVYLDAYYSADTCLLAAFTADWSPNDPKMFGTAYQNFRAAPIADSPPGLAD
jgi:hypothetical protein